MNELTKDLVNRASSHDASESDWHTLTLDVEGNIANGDQHTVNLLDSRADLLSGKSITTFINGLPFSVKTPGYNLAYAVFHGAQGTPIRRAARSESGRNLMLDTVLSSRNVNGKRLIFLDYRQSH